MSGSAGRAYAGRTPDERDAQRRARLLSAGREIIGTQGYAATTVEKICAEAKVSSRHFYLLYDTKEDVFVDVYRQIVDESTVEVAAALTASAGQPLRARLPAAFLAYLRPMFADMRAARIAFVEVMGASARLEEIRLAYRDTLIAVVEAEGAAAVARGEVADRDFRFAALALAGAATAIVYDWMLRPQRPSAEATQGKLVDLAVSLLTG